MLSVTFNESIRGYYERASIPKINPLSTAFRVRPSPPLATQQAIVARSKPSSAGRRQPRTDHPLRAKDPSHPRPHLGHPKEKSRGPNEGAASARRPFSALKTTDFERVIKALRAAALATLYGATTAQVKAMLDDANALKELLVQTIARSHPALPGDVRTTRCAACQRFLDNFEYACTFNYDLLLYWTHMHRENRDDVQSDDGFRTSQNDIESGVSSDYVVWESGQSHDQNMWFLRRPPMF